MPGLTPEAERYRRRNDTGESAWPFTWIGVFFQFLSLILTWTFVLANRKTQNIVHGQGTIHPQDVGVAKAVLDIVLAIVMGVVAGIATSADNCATFLNIGTHAVVGAAMAAISALTFVSFEQEGYDGLVGAVVDGASRMAKRVYIYIPPAHAHTIEGSARGNWVRVWIASGVLEGITALLYFIAILLMMRTKWRRSRD